MGKKQINDFYISGRIIHVGMPVSFPGKNELLKRVLVMEVWAEEKYKNEVAFDFVNAKMDLLNNIREGDWCDVAFFLRGRKHIQSDGKVRWYNNLEGLSCTKIE